MARTSSDLGTDFSSTRRPTGAIIAPAMPWNMRAATSSGRFCDRPQNSELVAKVMMAMRKMFLAPKRSAAQPLIGRKTAALSRYCLLYTSDAADDLLCVDLGGRRIIKK